MQKQKENLFSNKFKLLNSQENTEQIIWTSSDSSEFDNTSNCERLSNITNKARKRKRKLKKKVPKNISILDVTVVDVHKGCNEASNAVKVSKLFQKCDMEIEKTSPIINREKVYFPPFKCSKYQNSSPILLSKASDDQKGRSLPEQSPILISKYASPKISPSVRKKLFETVEKLNEESETRKEAMELNNRSCSPILLTKRDGAINLYRCKSEALTRNNSKISTAHTNTYHISNNNDLLENNKSNIKETITIAESSSNEGTKSSKFEQNNLDDSVVMLKMENCELVQRVKSYFDSHFSSDAISQCSISDSLTPRQSSKTSDEIEILNYITQINSAKNNSQAFEEKGTNPTVDSSESAEINEKSRKIHYKKGGLAYRLNSLLKKQMANISLWQHEKFMAENSNFVIPKAEHCVFRIQRVDIKYGCFLIQGVNPNEESFLIFINNKYVQNFNIVADMILKLYEPYKILDYTDKCKLIINVCKFECLSIKV